MDLYLVDSNFFIQAHRAFYPIDVMVSFWLKINQIANSGKIISIDKVKNEIFAGSSHEDTLKKWCKTNLPDNFFMDSRLVIEAYIEIVNWANSMNHQFKQKAIQDFLMAELADSWLVAYAKTFNCIIVTYEKSEPNRKSKIKIPEVCKQFGVKYINTIDMLRELNEQI